jgi:uncharacterized protein (DUF1697 family)
MPSHVALLRGINLGGRNKVAMADLRAVVAGLGHTDVATYIQSGNVLFSTAEPDSAALAGALEEAIATQLGVRSRVLVLSRAELAQVAAANPYPAEADPRRVHVVFLAAEPPPELTASLAGLLDAVAAKGSRDTARYLGRALYLHTPDGFGRSELAALLARSGGPMSARGAGTARNWATVTKLLELCGRPG